MYTVVCSKS